MNIESKNILTTKNTKKKQDAGFMIHDTRKNPKPEYQNPKWFGQLTILSQVEGQIPKIKKLNHEEHEEKT